MTVAEPCAVQRQPGEGRFYGQIASEVYAEQIATAFRQLPIALAVNLANAVLAASVLISTVSRPAVIWAGAIASVSFARAVLWWRHRRAGPSADPRPWSKWAAVGGLFAGLCWGLGGALIFPLLMPLAQLFVTIVIGGMCLGAVVVSATHLPTLLGFVLAASLPMAARLLSDAAPNDRALGAMIVVFAGAMALAGRHLNRVVCETIRLRVELDAASLRLNAEITQHRATEAALYQAQKLEAIGQLTGGIAHDFNNLLTVVIGNLTMAKTRGGDNPVIAPLIDGAAQAAERGVALIQRLLGFARRQRLEPQPVDIGAVLSGMKEMLSSTLGPQIRLAINAVASAPAAEVDPGQLELAILNLAANARDAMPEGGTLQITFGLYPADAKGPHELAAGDYVVLAITDTGLGMNAETLSRAFDPFFTTKEVGFGTGLGLPMVQAFAVQSGGAVRIESAPGAGTRVELWLPRAEGQATTEPALGSAPDRENSGSERRS